MLPLLPQVFNILSALIEERAGLHYRIEDLEHLRDKVSARAEQLGFESLLDYYYYLRYDANGDVELDVLIEHLVVHETYFFREHAAVETLAAMVEERVGARDQVEERAHRLRAQDARQAQELRLCAGGDAPRGG